MNLVICFYYKSFRTLHRLQRRTSTTVAPATTSEEQGVTLVASSETKLRPSQLAALKPGEVPVSGTGHPEATIFNWAQSNNMQVVEYAASRPLCSGCWTAGTQISAKPVSPLKNSATVTTNTTSVKPD